MKRTSFGGVSSKRSYRSSQSHSTSASSALLVRAKLGLTEIIPEVERFYEDLQDVLELTPPKDVLLIIGDWNAKIGSQDIPGSAQFSRSVMSESL